MKTTLSLLFFSFVVLIVACDPAAKSKTANAQTPRYDPNAPAVQSNPQPSNVPNSPNAAPATYGRNGAVTPRSVDQEAAPRTYASAAAVAAPLIGSWVNNSDPDETVVFTDHSYATYYDNELVVEEEMTYHPLCPGDCSGGQVTNVPCFTITSEFGTDCFGIVRVTATELELSVMGVSTETVTYVKVNP